jgi:hypothetical protein
VKNWVKMEIDEKEQDRVNLIFDKSKNMMNSV